MSNRRRGSVPRKYIYDYDDPNIDNNNKLSSFKNFDYKGYKVDSGKLKKADSLLKTAWKKLKRISTSEEVRWVAGLIITYFIISGKEHRGRNSDDTMDVLKDIHSGRVDFDTLESAKDALSNILNRVKK